MHESNGLMRRPTSIKSVAMMFGKQSSTIALTPLTSADKERLEALCHECSDFFELVRGQPVHAETAEEILGPLPDTMHDCCSKVVLGLECKEALIGIVELLEGYPKPREWYVGLLIVLGTTGLHGRERRDRPLSPKPRLAASPADIGKADRRM